MAYCEETGEALAAILRPGNAGSNTAGDHVAVVEHALAQVPAELIETIEILVRTDSAGATHEFIDFCREQRLRFSAGYELTDQVRVAILKIPETAWFAHSPRTAASARTGKSPRSLTTWIWLRGRPDRG
jgi:Transposase DDE domain group 1